MVLGSGGQAQNPHHSTRPAVRLVSGGQPFTGIDQGFPDQEIGGCRSPDYRQHLHDEQHEVNETIVQDHMLASLSKTTSNGIMGGDP